LVDGAVCLIDTLIGLGACEDGLEGVIGIGARVLLTLLRAGHVAAALVETLNQGRTLHDRGIITAATGTTGTCAGITTGSACTCTGITTGTTCACTGITTGTTCTATGTTCTATGTACTRAGITTGTAGTHHVHAHTAGTTGTTGTATRSGYTIPLVACGACRAHAALTRVKAYLSTVYIAANAGCAFTAVGTGCACLLRAAVVTTACGQRKGTKGE